HPRRRQTASTPLAPHPAAEIDLGRTVRPVRRTHLRSAEDIRLISSFTPGSRRLFGSHFFAAWSKTPAFVRRYNEPLRTMSLLKCQITLSLDGFVAGPNQGL